MDRRRVPRAFERRAIRLQSMGPEGPEGDVCDGLTVNRSRGGLCVLSPRAWSEGSEVWVEILGDQDGEAIPARARVMWCREATSPFVVGLEILWIQTNPLSMPMPLCAPI